jgi:phage tail-like protein
MTAYDAFNFVVALRDSTGADAIVAGFSEVSGLESEIPYVGYRSGNDLENQLRRFPMFRRTGDVTLKRGLVDGAALFEWLRSVRDGTPDMRTVTITLLDERRQPACRWVLSKAQPTKWVGPTLVDRGGDEVAMEELTLVADGIDVQEP